MNRPRLQERRRYVGWGSVVVLVLGFLWWFSPGLPILVGPWAWSGQKERGQALFEHHWSPGDALAGGDGLGPVFNATSCVSCHFQGGLGGAGGRQGDVTHYIVRETRQNPAADGILHA
ncbi:MAG TPA: di-heme oxidoredictase family protein, partial [Gemmatales bacterium]|nr:di-heme oxidoredictase family protein [Gemmatales bacterium]